MKSRLWVISFVFLLTFICFGYMLRAVQAGIISGKTGPSLTNHPTSRQSNGLSSPSASEQPTGQNRLVASSLSTTFSETIYLPLVWRPFGELYGQVLENGMPISSPTTVNLAYCLLYDFVPAWQDTLCVKAQTLQATTDNSGWYRFVNLPTLVVTGPLSITQSYQVYWGNDDQNPNRLGSWWTNKLSSYTSGDAIDLGKFDISDVRLIAPQASATVSVPVTFRWARRMHTPSDSYSPCIWGWPGNTSRPVTSTLQILWRSNTQFEQTPFRPRIPPPPTYLWCSPPYGYDPPLGYADQFILNSIGDVNCRAVGGYGGCFWGVNVYDQNGGYGYSREYFNFYTPQ